MDKQPLRILQVSTADTGGGAEKIAWGLFNQYRQHGFNSWLAVGEKHTSDTNVFVLPNQQLRGSWYEYFHRLALRYRKRRDGVTHETLISRLAGGMAEPLRRLEYHLGMEDFHYPGTSRLLAQSGSPVDILHAHNLHGAYFDLRMLPTISQHVPTLMTLHDAWLLSGHCAHSFDCERWKSGCGACPDLTIYPAIKRDATHYNWQRKRDIYNHSRFYVATPSRWLMNKVENSILVPAILDARIIPNGVDLNTFHPTGQHDARNKLGFHPDTHVLLTMGTRYLDSNWKDNQTLHQAMVHLANNYPGHDTMLLILGSDAPLEYINQVEIRPLPYQEDPQTVAQYYQAADVYVHPARADTFPTSILEALACGIPVVATALGGIPEQIDNDKEGFLVSPRDAAGMADKIGLLLADSTLRQSIGISAAARAKRYYSLEQQADAYLDWYVEIIERAKRS